MPHTANIGGETVNLYCFDVLASIRSRDGVSDSYFVASEISLSSLEDGGAKGYRNLFTLYFAPKFDCIKVEAKCNSQSADDTS